MRSTILIAFVTLSLTTIPLAAAEDEPNEPPTFACHDWEVFYGDRNATAVGVSTDDGAVYLGLEPDDFADVDMDTIYVVSDGTALSVWAYTEENGEPGLQRGGADPCDESSPMWGHDCFVSCTF